MTASGQAMAASKDVETIRAVAKQMKTMLGQINSVRMQAKDHANKAKGQLAAAAQTAAGGVGTGQQLQTRVGQSEVKLDELGKVLQTAANMCDGIDSHAAGVEQDIQTWAATLRS